MRNVTAVATFRFYGELNFFLPDGRQQTPFPYPFHPPQAVKHLIESAGVPHPEVSLILANGQQVNFHYMVQHGDRVAVYPLFMQLSPEPYLRPPLSRPVRFVLDIHLGHLARYLRLLGFDTLYPDHNHNDAELAQIAHDEGRVLLSRDRGLLKRRVVTHGYCLRSRDSRQQLTAVLRRYDLFDQIQPLPRCLRCNGLLRPVAKEAILHRLEPKTKRYYHDFHICQQCDQIYWKGSHYQRIQAFIAGVREEAKRYGENGR